MIRIVKADGAAEKELILSLRLRAAQTAVEINRAAAEILEDVRLRGFDAVREHSLRLDGAEPFEIPPERLEEALKACSPELVRAMRRSIENVKEYNSRLAVSSAVWQNRDGGTVGRIVRGLTRVGIYVPGGRAAYPSSVIMNAIPARAAGVEEIVMATPPTKNLNTAVLAAAKLCGIDRVIAVGGVQAVAALSFGAGFIPRVDKLVGPGNAYVAAAKRMVFGTVDIDMVAGPSEVLVLADSSANPAWVAADLLSQAEHDPMAASLLVTDSAELAEAVSKELSRQTSYLEKAEIIRQSLRDFGAAIVCPSLEAGMSLANEIAPEHLEILTEEPRRLLPLVKNAGAVFLGSWSPEPLGDYLAGPSHVLPTSGTARFFSPLSADSFRKSISVVEYGKDALFSSAEDIMTFADSEGLTAHANSIRIRSEGEK
ncbi:histidinol dehydrogenase [Papillibacter cinnamivorans]|uniref:Histidinol dehydrogenase n=1 Tax=Papillibacter cinnamivorans DSM 12816 TaxID=1122930 RepID=A0A1W1YN22_9FIRM|nr:histidinol dehydrogenase [Papillibacter cinnamivorans]SMC37118.1 histidinol dehydrogenase [Papillibacter cinnamivorans DSM 12816]